MELMDAQESEKYSFIIRELRKINKDKRIEDFIPM
jgi:hypothetical protein